MFIRKESESDFTNIYELVKIAFETAQVSDGKEQDFVNQLRNGNNYIPDLALVAEENNKLIGHIMLTRMFINKDNEQFETLYLAPLSVAIEYRKQGIGTKLINESFKLARDLGYTSVVLVGNPLYYNRFGFRSSIDFDIKNINNIPDEYVMACELIPNALNKISGTVDFK